MLAKSVRAQTMKRCMYHSLTAELRASTLSQLTACLNDLAAALKRQFFESERSERAIWVAREWD